MLSMHSLLAEEEVGLGWVGISMHLVDGVVVVVVHH